MHNYILHSYSMICYIIFHTYTFMCKEFTDYSTRILLWQWGKLVSTIHIRCLHVFATFRPTPKLQVDAKEALTNGYQRGPWQSRWSLSWKFQWHSEKTNFVNGKQDTCIILYNCIHVLFRNISFSCFSFWFRSCTLHWWMSDKAIIFQWF